MTDIAKLDPTDPLALAEALIKCPSVTPQEGGALALVADVLKDLGFVSQRLTFADENTPDVENLFSRLGTRGPTLCFAGHTDVVPPGDTSRWTRDPFAAEVADGRLYGRGAVDMKGAVACFIAATARTVAAHGAPKGSIAFLLTGDEEGPAINGTRKVLAWMKELGEEIDHCLVGEPTNVAALGDTIKIGRRGSLSGTIEIVGRQGHVAYPERAANPCRAMVELLARLMHERLDDGNRHFQPSNLEITSIDVGNPTHNIIPPRAQASFNIRFNDRHTPKSLMALIGRLVDERVDGTRFRAKVTYEPNPGDSFLTTAGGFVDAMREAVKGATGHEPELTTGGGTSDARFIKDHCPVLEFGLVGDTMHQIDENVPVADLETLTRIYQRLIQGYFARLGG
ncbi:succinyl-diaminopimelate desuccinylase [Lutibaculum baratangense]|uniref:Succinyl-diaminopimelate desuccinylase n=1 Tax=Lutibaculum baratangense AMV1 TaxID=631454 RepID=V4RP01_9HYPH|nr:succinyl-diaminopimelate desuccinylase [Lutibaculum baratangense]ESR26984.1 N-succinyl-L,L-diaminopimelate desuccinylase [Lutibaculum baratangense AMV1]